MVMSHKQLNIETTLVLRDFGVGHFNEKYSLFFCIKGAVLGDIIVPLKDCLSF